MHHPKTKIGNFEFDGSNMSQKSWMLHMRLGVTWTFVTNAVCIVSLNDGKRYFLDWGGMLVCMYLSALMFPLQM